MNRILFYLAHTSSIPIIKSLVEYLQEVGHHDFGFYLTFRSVQDFPEEWMQYRICELPEQAVAFQPDFVIVPGDFVDYRIPGIKAHIFHGLAVEKDIHYRVRPLFDIYFTSGPIVTSRFQRLQKHYPWYLVQETGWPKMDYILNYPRKDLKKKLSLPEDRQIILYAPTIGDKIESATELLPIIPEIIRKNEHWCIKFHDNVKPKLIKIFEKYLVPDCEIVQANDIVPYLHAADLLISDTSSVIYEFMILDKPVITFRTRCRFDKGVNIFRPEQLRSAVDRCLAKPEEHHFNRIMHLNEVNPYRDGKCGQRIIEYLFNLADNEEVNRLTKRSPNFFHKFQSLTRTKF